jgi:hypothetical protein
VISAVPGPLGPNGRLAGRPGSRWRCSGAHLPPPTPPSPPPPASPSTKATPPSARRRRPPSNRDRPRPPLALVTRVIDKQDTLAARVLLQLLLPGTRRMARRWWALGDPDKRAGAAVYTPHPHLPPHPQTRPHRRQRPPRRRPQEAETPTAHVSIPGLIELLCSRYGRAVDPPAPTRGLMLHYCQPCRADLEGPGWASLPLTARGRGARDARESGCDRDR